MSGVGLPSVMPTLKVATHDGARLDYGACMRTATLLTWLSLISWIPSLVAVRYGLEAVQIVLLRTPVRSAAPTATLLTPDSQLLHCLAGAVALELFSVPSLRKSFWHHCFEYAVLLRPLRLLKIGWIAPASLPCWTLGSTCGTLSGECCLRRHKVKVMESITRAKRVNNQTTIESVPKTRNDSQQQKIG